MQGNIAGLDSVSSSKKKRTSLVEQARSKRTEVRNPSDAIFLNKLSTDETSLQKSTMQNTIAESSVTRLLNVGGNSGVMFGDQFQSFRSPQHQEQYKKLDQNLSNQKYLGAFHTGAETVQFDLAKQQYFQQSSYNNSTFGYDQLKKESKYQTTNVSQLNQQSGVYLLKGGSIQQSDDLNISMHEHGGVSYNRFKANPLSGLTSRGTRLSLQEIAQQNAKKKNKEMTELMLERQNIENMIVNSKLWSPPFSGRARLMSSESLEEGQRGANTQTTTNVFGDKREELTKILRKRLSYIHQQSSVKQGGAGATVYGSGSLKTPKRQRPDGKHSISTSPKNMSGLKRKGMNLSIASPREPQQLNLINQNSEEKHNGESKLPGINQHKSRQGQYIPGKGGNPFLPRNIDGSIDKKPVITHNTYLKPKTKPVPPPLDLPLETEPFKPSPQQQKPPSTLNNPLAEQVDNLINDDNMKRGLREQLQHSITKGASISIHQHSKATRDLHKLSPSLESKELKDRITSTSIKKQLIYQTDIQVKMGKINKAMDEEFETLDQAMEYLKMKKPHEFGMDIPGVLSPTSIKHMKTKKVTGSGMPHADPTTHSNSLNYVSVIKSNYHGDGDVDSLMDEGLNSHITEEQIRNFAIMLMRQRLNIGNKLNRQNSFNTAMGMAFSMKNENPDGKQDESSSDQSGSDSDNDDKKGNKQKHHHQEHPLEAERFIQQQEAKFMKTIQGNLTEEFNITGTSLPPQQVEESLYVVTKKKMSQKKQTTMDDVYPEVEVFMKKLKNFTIEAFTQDVKARNSFFQFISQHNNAVFVDKFMKDPKINYFLECNKESVVSLPIVAKIQQRSLNLFGYRLNSGVCKSLRIYLENFKNALIRLALDNNGIDRGDALHQLLQGVQTQEDFKSLVIIRNAVDEGSVEVINNLLKRQFPKQMEELRIINCKISPKYTLKILQQIDEGNCQLRKLSLAGAQINENSLALLAEIVENSRNLIDLDISWNGLRPGQSLKKFLEALSHNRTIQYLNLSWNNLMLPPPIVKEQDPSQIQRPMIVIQPDENQDLPPESSEMYDGQQPLSENEEIKSENFEEIKSQRITSAPQEQPPAMGTTTTPFHKKEPHHKLDDYTQSLLDNLSRFIKYNKHLIHLDLSYTRLDEMMITALGTALRRAKSLIAVHLSGNPGASQTTADYLQQRVHCRPHKDRDLKTESQNMLQVLNSKTPKQHRAYEGILLSQILHKQKIVKTTTGGQSFKPDGDEGQIMQFQRWLGHKYEIPASGQWQMNSAWQDIKDQCWVCNKWCYTVIYWSPSVQVQIYKTYGPDGQAMIPNQQQIQQVRKLVRTKPSQLQSGAPLIAGSFSNWEAREMIPIIDYCEAIDANKPDPLSVLKKQGKIKDEIEKEEELNEKQKGLLQRVKDQIRQEYQFKWKNCILKSLKYKRAQHLNLDFATEVDVRKEPIYVHVVFGPPGQHMYYVGLPQDGIEHINKCIINMREDEIPLFEKDNKSKVQQRVFKKDTSVFRDWKEDTAKSLENMFLDDIRFWKIGRFIKDDNDRERTMQMVGKHFLKIKKVFTSLICQSGFPNITWIDFGSFCERCKIIDGKGVTISTVDRSFIAATVAMDGVTLSPDKPANALCRFEFLEILCRLAQAKYKETGICPTYEDSINKLLEEHVIPFANPEPWQEWRDEQLWTIEVNDVLEVNLEGCKKMYNFYKEPRKNHMTMQDGLNFMMKDTGLQLIEKDSIFCFGMCKMSVILEQDKMGQYKILQFVEFLEMLCRIAQTKFKDNPEINEGYTLAQKLEKVLDIVLQMVNVERKDVVNNVVEESESDDDY